MAGTTTAPIRAQETAEAARAEPPVVIDADNSFYDLRSGVTRFEDNVSITRGAMAVEADRGVVRQSEGQITEVELEGAPSTWRDQLDDGSIVRGEARDIRFDVLANVITLTGNAIIRHEQGEFTGDELVYDLTAESLAGRSTGNERVRVVIEPGAMSDPRPAQPPSNDPPPGDGAAPDDAGTDPAPADDATTSTERAETDATLADETLADQTLTDGDGTDENESDPEPPADPGDR